MHAARVAGHLSDPRQPLQEYKNESIVIEVDLDFQPGTSADGEDDEDEASNDDEDEGGLDDEITPVTFRVSSCSLLSAACVVA